MKSTAIIAFICSIYSISYSTSALADTLTCTLSNESKSESLSLDLEDTKTSENGLYGKHGVLDLNFYLTANCKDKKCQGSVTIDSNTTEEEVGQFAFQFEQAIKRVDVLKENLSNPSDRRKYDMICGYYP